MSMIDGLKTAGKVLHEAGKIEQYEQILDAQQKMLEMQSNIADLIEENKRLKQKLELQTSLSFENNAYWSVTDEKKDGPFCSRCWDVDKNTVRLTPGVNNRSFSTCPGCSKQFQTDPSFTPVFTSRKPPFSNR